MADIQIILYQSRTLTVIMIMLDLEFAITQDIITQIQLKTSMKVTIHMSNTIKNQTVYLKGNQINKTCITSLGVVEKVTQPYHHTSELSIFSSIFNPMIQTMRILDLLLYHIQDILSCHKGQTQVDSLFCFLLKHPLTLLTTH